MRNYSISHLLIILFIAAQTSGYYLVQRKRNFIVNTFCPLPGGIFSYPGDCNQYVTCTFGRGCVMNCPKGLHFSPHHRVCTKPEKAQCVTDPINIHIIPIPHCSRGYQAIVTPEEGAVIPIQPQPVTSPLQAISFPTEPTEAPVETTTAKVQRPIVFPAKPEQPAGGFIEITFPEEPSSLPDVSQTGEGFAPGGSSQGTMIHVEDSDEVSQESDEDSEEYQEASFEDWENWIDWFNTNRHTAPVFKAVKESYPDPRMRHSGRRRKPNVYSKKYNSQSHFQTFPLVYHK